MNKKIINILLDRRGAMTILEVFIAAAISIAAYFAFTNMYEKDSLNVAKLTAKWRAQIIAESVANTISTLTVDEMFKQIVTTKTFKISTDILPVVYKTGSGDPRYDWLETWVNSTPRVTEIQYELKVLDKDQTEMDASNVSGPKPTACFESIDNFKRCHKKITTIVTYNYEKDDLKTSKTHKVTWITRIMGKELPDFIY